MHKPSRFVLGVIASLLLHVMVLGFVYGRSTRAVAPATALPESMQVRWVEVGPAASPPRVQPQSVANPVQVKQPSAVMRSASTARALPKGADSAGPETAHEPVMQAVGSPASEQGANSANSAESPVTWTLPDAQIRKIASQKSVAEQARQQVGSALPTTQQTLAHNMERAVKPGCMEDRGLGLLGLPLIVKDMVQEKCK
jgi:hypothetical protein